MCTQHNTYHRACSKSLLCSPMPCSPAVEPICLRPNSVVFKCLPRLLNGNCVLKTRRHIWRVCYSSPSLLTEWLAICAGLAAYSHILGYILLEFTYS